MRSFSLIALFAYVAQAHDVKEAPPATNEKSNLQSSTYMDDFVKNMVNKLVDRANQHYDDADMDDTTLGKPGDLAAPSLSQDSASSDQPVVFLIEDLIKPDSDGTLLEDLIKPDSD